MKHTAVLLALSAFAMLAFVALWFIFPAEYIRTQAPRGAQYFGECFAPSTNGYICAHEDYWAINCFAGTEGLPHLKRLSRDLTLAEPGRALASNLYNRISSGEHLDHIQWRLDNWHADSPVWKRWTPMRILGRRYNQYLMKKDRRYLARERES